MPYLTPRPALAYLDALTGRLVLVEPVPVSPAAVPAVAPTTDTTTEEEDQP